MRNNFTSVFIQLHKMIGKMSGTALGYWSCAGQDIALWCVMCKYYRHVLRKCKEAVGLSFDLFGILSKIYILSNRCVILKYCACVRHQALQVSWDILFRGWTMTRSFAISKCWALVEAFSTRIEIGYTTSGNCHLVYILSWHYYMSCAEAESNLAVQQYASLNHL